MVCRELLALHILCAPQLFIKAKQVQVTTSMSPKVAKMSLGYSAAIHQLHDMMQTFLDGYNKLFSFSMSELEFENLNL